MKNQKGFTLIEMMIVIAIIAILAGIVIVGLGPVQRQARDSRRISDLNEVQTGLELYFNKCGYYPGTAQATSPCGAFTQISVWSDMTNALTGSAIGINQVPNDPSSGKNYVYATDSIGSQYVVAATLEDGNNPAFKNRPTGNILNVSCGSPVYCIQL